MTFDEILTEAKQLREGLPLAKSLPTPEQIKGEILLRKRLQNSLRELENEHRRMIAAYEADMRERARVFRQQQDAATDLVEEAKDVIRDLRTESAFLAADIDDLTGTMYDRIRAEKEIPKGRNATHPQFQ